LSVKETPEYYQLVIHILCDLICDVINYCASIFDMEKFSVYDQIVIKNLKMRIYINFFKEFLSIT